MQKNAKEPTNFSNIDKQPRNKAFYTFETRKLGYAYLESQR